VRGYGKASARYGSGYVYVGPAVRRPEDADARWLGGSDGLAGAIFLLLETVAPVAWSAGVDAAGADDSDDPTSPTPTGP
jgi:hypothetical protein